MKYRASATRAHHFEMQLRKRPWREIPLAESKKVWLPDLTEEEIERTTWHALYCDPRQELTAFLLLSKRLGLKCFLPVIHGWSSNDKRRLKYEFEKPVFQRYLLVASDRVLPWLRIRETLGILGVVSVAGAPLPIRGSAILEAMQKQEKNWDVPADEVTLPFTLGGKVTITEGPFASFPGTVTEVDNHRRRLKADVSIFGRPTPVELEFKQVEAA